MITGSVNSDLEAVVRISLFDSEDVDHPVDAVIDTGFTGLLTIPLDLASAVGAIPAGHTLVVLGDGREVVLPAYRVRLEWDGKTREVAALGAGGSPLIGMELLTDHQLTIDVRPDGFVAARRLRERTEPIRLEYRLTDIGWSSCRIVSLESEITVDASYNSDALGDLVSAVVAMMDAQVSSHTVSFLGEPGEYQWRLERAGKQITIQILWYHDWTESGNVGDGELQFEATVPWERFLVATYWMLDDVLRCWGLDGYRREWDRHEFPLEDFVRLHSAATAIIEKEGG